MKKLIKIAKGIIGSGALIIFTAFFTIQCEPPIVYPSPIEADLMMMEYIELNDSIYSEFQVALEKTGLNHILKTRGPYTLFLPDNRAMEKFYNKHGISSSTDINSDELKNLLLNHLVVTSIKSNQMGFGSIGQLNAIGDNLISEYNVSELIINKTSLVTDRDIEVANGVIHRVNTVIEIVTDNIGELLSKDDKFSIFYEALQRTGIADTLKKNKVPYGKKDVRVRYTILAVPDSVYEREGITDFDKLVETYGDADTNYRDYKNKFYQYVDYHCLSGTYFLTDIPDNEATFYTISRENQVSMGVTNDYKINTIDSTGDYTSFIFPLANISAKNGVIHGIDGTLPVQERSTGNYVFYVTHYPDLMEEKCYVESYLQNFYNTDQFHEIRWGGGDYFQYYFKTDNSEENNDMLSMSQDYWWLELYLPKIKRGKYDIQARFKAGANRANCLIYIDGVRVAEPWIMNSDYSTTDDINFDFYNRIIARVDWAETGRHYIKLQTINPGVIYWDNLTFIPVEE